MHQELFNLFNQFNQQAYDTTRELTEINARTFGRLADKQVELANVTLDGVVRQAELVREAKDTNNYFKDQAALTRQYGEKVTKAVRESLEIVNQARDEYVQWTEKSVQEASANLNKVQEKAEKSVRKAA